MNNKNLERQAIKCFNMNDLSRLLLSIDEKNGCHRTESIEYITEEGETLVDYKSEQVPVTGLVGFGKKQETQYIKS